MSRLDQTFKKLDGEKALAVYLMASDPSHDLTVKLMRAVAENGADIIELGMWFSDPMADGPTIQKAAMRAKKAGGSMKETLSILKRFRAENNTTPVVMMGYLNPVMKYGLQKFAEDFSAAGADAVIIVDLPHEEENELTNVFSDHDFPLIKLIAPTTSEERLLETAKDAKGFLYLVTVAGVTGVKESSHDVIKAKADAIRRVSKVPVMAGFGIKTPQHVAGIVEYVDGVVVGSAIVEKIGAMDNSDLLIKELSTFVRALKDAALKK